MIKKLLPIIFIFFAITVAVGTLFFLWASLNIMTLSAGEINQNIYLRPYYLYTVGEFMSLVGLLGICVPLIFNIDPPPLERFGRRNLLFLLFMLLVLSVAYTVRTPVMIPKPPKQDNNALSIMQIQKDKVENKSFSFTRYTQLYFLAMMGILSSILGIIALMKKWPRTLIILLLSYFMYFSTGPMILSGHFAKNTTGILMLSLMIMIILLISILALLKQAPDKTETKQQADNISEDKDDKDESDSQNVDVVTIAANIGSLAPLVKQINQDINMGVDSLKNFREQAQHLEQDRLNTNQTKQSKHELIMKKLDKIDKQLQALLYSK